MEGVDLKYQLTASIVLYHENLETLTKTVNSFLEIPLRKKLYLIDNSKTDLLRNKFEDSQISYMFLNKNIGFGPGHNHILSKINKQSQFHLILNPDLKFEANVVLNLIAEFSNYENLALIAPKVLYPDKSQQTSCRRYPSLSELVIRSFPLFKKIFKKVIDYSQYGDRTLEIPFKPDVLHGCFYLIKTEIFLKLEGFDKRFFLYMEDVDLCRKIDKLGMDKLYFPTEYVYHELRKGSSHNPKLFLIHFSSSIKYFFKWGFSSKKS